MSKPIAKLTRYSNATSFKMHNVRITAMKLPNDIVLQFLKADDIVEPHAVCTRIKGRVSSTVIRLSNAGAELTMLALAEQLGYDTSTFETK